MKKTMWKTTVREIRLSLGRYLAILAIVALGVGLFSGLKITKPLMIDTADDFFREKNLYDFRLVSTYGFEDADVAFLAEQDEVRSVQGSYTYDVLYNFGDSDATMVMKVHSLTAGINELSVLAGRLPENAKECIVDSNLYGEDAIGQTIHLSVDNEEDTLDSFRTKEFTITGIANASYYIQFERGNTSIGNGKVDGFMYVLPEAFDSEIYTEVFVRLLQDFPLYSEEYDAYIEQQEVLWEEHLNESADQRFDRIQAEAYEELDKARQEFETEKADAEAELFDAKVKLDDAAKEIADGKAQIADGKAQISDGKREISAGYAQIRENEQTLDAGAAQLEANKALMEEKEQELAEGIAVWEANKALLDEQKAPLEAAEAELNAQEEELLAKEQELLALKAQLESGMIPEEQRPVMEEMLAAGMIEIEAGKVQIAAARQQIAEGYSQIAEAEAQMEAGWAELELGRQQLEAGKAQITAAEAELSSGRAQIAEGKRSLAVAEEELADAEQEIADAEAELAEGEAEYADGLKEYADGLAEFETEIADAEAEIADAEKEIQDMELPDCYVLGRDTNVGYVCLDNDSSIVKDVADVFPVFFFLIAALVCMTTMNRMIEEQRTQIGILKALGYSRSTIMGKYLFYAGSAAGIGCISGYFLGTFLLSRVIWSAYRMMYNLSTLNYFIDWKLAVISLICSMICSMGVTWFSCRMELSEVAASLMRPKSPKAGKRVFLEYVPFIWKRLSFLVKVSIRNVFRYKKRFFMMIIGISGSMALLVTGFGIQDSIADVTVMQYNEILKYHMGVTFRDVPDAKTMEAFEDVIEGRVSAQDMFMEGSVDLTFNGNTKSVSIVVPQSAETFGEYIDLHTLDGESIAFPKMGEAVLSHKIAETYGIQIGDTVQLMDEEHHAFEVTISDICQNFVYNYIFLHADTCTQRWKAPEWKAAYMNVPEDGADIHLLSADLMALEEIANVTVNQDVQERFDNMMASMDFLVVVIIFCAAVLAFIVLYNLTNINITERIREIATIKVLGFYKKETASYVFRENVALTAIGSLAGLFLGKIFHAFVMSCIDIDMVAFDVRINPDSYLYSMILTFVFAWLVNTFMSGKLDKISMTESLKSVD